MTLNVVLIEGGIESQYNIIGLFLIVLFFTCTIAIWIKRIVKIYLITNKQNSIRTFLRSFVIFILFGSSIIIFYMTSTILYNTSGYISYISGGSIAFFGAIFILRNIDFYS